MSHWLQSVFDHPDIVGVLIIVAKTFVVYLFLVAGLRLLGKRELGQMTIYDLVLLIVLANAVQNAMVGSDTSLGGGIAAGMTLLLLNKGFSEVMGRNRRLRRAMIGDPSLVVNAGHLITSHMKREGVTKEQVMAALREHGITRVEDVRIAVLEVDGTISVVPNASSVMTTRHHYRALRLS